MPGVRESLLSARLREKPCSRAVETLSTPGEPVEQPSASVDAGGREIVELMPKRSGEARETLPVTRLQIPMWHLLPELVGACRTCADAGAGEKVEAAFFGR